MSCVALLESKVKSNNALRVSQTFGHEWKWIENYKKHPNGRIWLMWKSNEVTINKKTCYDQFMHSEICDIVGNRIGWLTVVYAHNQLSTRKTLWADISNVATAIHDQWMVIGDFNNVLTSADRIGGNPVQGMELEDLEAMMQSANFSEHENRGAHFTCSNKHLTVTIYLSTTGLGFCSILIVILK